MKKSQKNNRALCILILFCMTQPIEPGIDCSCMTECWKSLLSYFQNKPVRRTSEQQVPIIFHNSNEQAEEQLRNRVGDDISAEPFPSIDYSNVKFHEELDERTIQAPQNSSATLPHTHNSATLPPEPTTNQGFPSTDSESSFDECNSPQKSSSLLEYKKNE